MNFILLALILITIFITLLFVRDLRVKILLNTDESDLNMTLMWLYPLIMVLVTIENTKPTLTFYLFNKRLIKRTIKSSKSKFGQIDLYKTINPRNVCINTNYGFSDPFKTGITCGAIDIASQFLNIDSIEQSPDFMTIKDYIYLNATAKVNLGSALINLLRQKVNRRNLLWIRTQT